MIRRALTVAVLLAAPAAASSAGIPVTQQMTCPIGGERFSFSSTASYSTWGARPDGKPFGSWEFPLELPVCPGNGLVVYAEFSDAEKARLRPLIATDDYRALGRNGETSYYRAYWLMKRTDAPAPNTLWMLVQASWQAEGEPERRRRYLEELVAEAPSLGEPRDDVGLAIRARVINALRELGRFDEALAMLAATPVDAIAPESSTVRSTADWRGHYRSLRRLLDRRDASIEPLDMIPWREGRPRCEGEAAASLDAAQQALCRELIAAAASPS